MSDYAGSCCSMCGEDITETQAINNAGVCDECQYELDLDDGIVEEG